MSKIDVSKCEYYDSYYKDCSNYSITGSKPYCNPEELKCSYYIRYIEQQLQQLKAVLDEIEEIANAMVNGTHFTTDIGEHFKELAKNILQFIKQAKEGGEE